MTQTHSCLLETCTVTSIIQYFLCNLTLADIFSLEMWCFLLKSNSCHAEAFPLHTLLQHSRAGYYLKDGAVIAGPVACSHLYLSAPYIAVNIPFPFPAPYLYSFVFIISNVSQIVLSVHLKAFSNSKQTEQTFLKARSLYLRILAEVLIKVYI